MKKIVCMLLALSMLLPMTVSFAAETSDVEKMLTVVKERLGIDGEYDDFESNVNTYEEETRYSFVWSNKDDEKTGRLSVECDSNGTITSYYHDTNIKYDADRKFSKHEVADYEKAAQAYTDKLNPQLTGSVFVNKPDDYSLWSPEISFSLRFEHDGIIVDGMDGYLSLNAETMELCAYNLFAYSDLDYPDKSGNIDKAAAINAYKEKLGFELTYKFKDEKGAFVPYLVYVPKKTNEYINAADGEVYKQEENYDRFTNGMGNKMAMASEDSAAGFSPAEIKEIGNIKDLLDKDALEKKLRTSKLLNIPKDAKLKYSSLSRIYNTENEYIYSFDFGSPDEKEYYSYNVSVGAKSGRIMSFDVYRETEKSNEKNEKNPDVLQKSAEKYVAELAGEMLTDFVKDEDSEGETQSYIRYINDIPVSGDGISIVLDKVSGEIAHYSFSHRNVEFPVPENVITVEAAADAFFKIFNYDLRYILMHDGDYRKPNGAVAVYKFTDNMYNMAIDPYTGERHLEGSYEPEKIDEYSDIEGHYAEEQIKKLAEYGIGLNGGKFNPDNNIIQKDYIAMLVCAFEGNYLRPLTAEDYSRSYTRAARLDIITEDERDDDAAVTRMQAAIYLTRAMKAEKYAQMQNVWQCPFADVSVNSGYACIMYGLNIMKGDEKGCFNPDDSLTNADSAIIIYNSLNR